MYEIARSVGVDGPYMAAAATLSKAVDAAFGRHITMNSSCATAAVLCDIGIPVEIMRGLNVVARAVGLLAHIREEQLNPATWVMHQAVGAAVPYNGQALTNDPSNGSKS